MKQKILFKVLMLLVIAVSSVGLASCGSDDDETIINSPVVGTWKTAVYTSTVGGDLYFGQDGHFKYTLKTKSNTSVSEGTYEATETEDGIVKLFYSDGNILFWEYTITSNGKKMTTTPVGTSYSIAWEKQ